MCQKLKLRTMNTQSVNLTALKHTVVLLLGVIIFASCRNGQSSSSEGEELLWNCSELSGNTFALSSVAKSYRFLPLETNDSSLLGGINKMVYQDSLIYLLDARYTAKVFVFTAKDGRFVKKFGRIGNGPGEYTAINDFSIDQERQSIYVLADRNRLITYTLSGDYVATATLPFMATHMEYLNNRFYFVCDIADADNLLITDKDFKLLASHFPNSVYKDNYRILLHPLQKKENKILFHRFLDNQIYRINEDGELSVAYRIDFGMDAMSVDDIGGLTEKELKAMMKTKVGNVKYFTETDGYAFILYFDENKPCVSFFDRKTNQAESYGYASLKDDFIGKDFPILEYAFPNGTFTSVIPHGLIDYLLENKLIQHVNEDSNPVLYQLY